MPKREVGTSHESSVELVMNERARGAASALPLKNTFRT